MVAATGVSGLGDGLVFVAFPLLLAARTDDPRLTAAVVIAGRLPWLLLALPVGALADRHDRRRFLVTTEVSRALVLGAFGLAVLSGHLSIWLALGVVFLIGVGETAFVAGSHAVLPTLVPSEGLAQANGVLFSTTTAAENLIGPAIGGLLFSIAIAAPFIVDGVSFGLSAVLLFVALPVQPQVTEVTVEPLHAAIKEGVRYFRAQPALRSLVAMVTTLAFCQSMVFGVVVLFARDVLGLSSLGFGLLVMFAALGNVLGGTVAGRLDAWFGPSRLIPLAGVVAAVGYLVAGLTSRPIVSGAAFAAEAVAVAVGNVSSEAYRQRVVPPQLLGRLGNIYRFFINGAMPVGALAGGLLAYNTNLRAPFVAAALLQLTATAVLAPRTRRRLRSPDREPFG